jgi:SAM-dependent methyltransferase
MASLASSYYILYSEQSKGDNTLCKSAINQTLNSQKKDDNDNKSNNDNENNNKKSQFWQEFQWTTNEKEDVVKLLKQNQNKCDIVENSITQQRGQYIIDKFDKDASLHWNKFYSSHETNFFKDRHYLYKAFPNEFSIVYGNNNDCGEGICDSKAENKVEKSSKEIIDSEENFTITEIGCGVGNTVLPLLEIDPFILVPVSTQHHSNTKNDDNDANDNKEIYEKKNLVIWGLDFSSVGIELLRKDSRYINNTDRARAQVWDITSTHPKDIKTAIIATKISQQQQQKQQVENQYCLESSSDISLLLFVLSAISPDKMLQAAKNVASTLKPGGVLLLRDYGRYDEAQIKLGTSRNKRLAENFYVKHDGTRCYYFTIEDVERLFGSGSSNEGNESDVFGNKMEKGAGLEVLEMKYVQRLYKNRADDATRRRVWVQARFRKPL